MYLVFLVAVELQKNNIKMLLGQLLKLWSHDFARTTPIKFPTAKYQPLRIGQMKKS